MEISDINKLSINTIFEDKEIISTLFNLLNISWFAVDKDGKILVWNKILMEVVKKVLPNTNLENLTVADIDKKTWDNLLDVMQKGVTQTVQETAPNGRWYLSVKSPILHCGEIKGVIGIAVDITKQKQAEIAKLEFTENMSHDLRTPFTGIFAAIKMLYDQETDSDKKEWLGYIKDSSKWLLDFLNETIDVIKNGQSNIEASRFNLKDIIAEVTGLLTAEIKHKGLSLITYCPDIYIITDRLKVSRILLNLLGNAVRYTNGGSIKITLESVSPLKISIMDTGIGIPNESLEKIFDQYTKLKPSHEQNIFSGIGVGLYLARSYARELGGDITVTSELGKGSCFTLLLKN